MVVALNRRQFGLGASALLLGAGSGLPAWAQSGTKSVTTPLGTYDIPLNPQRVVCIDHRNDFEPAYLLGLNVIGYGHWDARDFVPVPDGVVNLAMPTTAEKVLALNPDLIICSGEDPDGEWWPARRLLDIAPVLTTTFTQHWTKDLRQLGAWLDRTPQAEAGIATYDAKVADLAARYADVLKSKKIAVLTYEPDEKVFVAFPAIGTDYVDPKEALLADLKAISLDPALLSYNGFSLENAPDMLADVDAIMMCDMGGPGLSEVETLPLWSRLPAVAAGKVNECTGYTWYGSYFTAMHFAEALDELLGMLKA